jgi:hypothetical protein
MRSSRWGWGSGAALWLVVGLTAAAHAAPKLKAETPRVDLGEVTAGLSKVAEFTLSNAGTDPLKIEKVVPGCGCMTTSFPETLQPGEKGVVKVTLNSYALWSGTVEKHITVVSNDPEQASMDLQLTAKIRPLFAFSPQNPSVVNYKKGQPVKQVFTVTPDADSKLKITGIAPGAMMAEGRILPPEPGDKPGTVRIEVTAHPPDGGGDFMGIVPLATTHPTLTVVPLLINAVSSDGITVSPSFLYLTGLGTSPKASPATTVALFKRSGAFRVLEVKSDNAAFKATVNEEAGAAVPGGATYREITIRYLGGLPKGQVSGKIIVTTDDPGAAKIEIPYQATIGDVGTF